MHTALDDLEAAFDKLASLSFDALTPRELLAVVARREELARRTPAVDYRLLQRLCTQASPAELGGTTMAGVLASRLRISRSEAHRRLDQAADLGPRTTLTGQPLEPRLPATAAAQARGQIGAEHVRIIRDFFAALPQHVDVPTREAAERDLARYACDFGPETFRRAAQRMATLLDQDGTLDENDRARRRGITIGRQQSDGMSSISGWLDPEARASLDAVLAKLAAPGMCNPEAEKPRVSGTPSEQEIAEDTRDAPQRVHDAVTAACRAVLAGGDLGQRNGLPVTIMVSTTLAELESAAGQALTAAGTLLPMSDVIRMAGHAHHYLTLFDGKGQALWLGRSRRIASPAQRIVLQNRDRGCTFPGCTVPGYLSEAHHLVDWADGGRTDVDDMALACGPHNRLATTGGWTTRRRRDGRIEWIPPPGVDHGQARVNEYHHPENLLAPDDRTGEDGSDDDGTGDDGTGDDGTGDDG